MRNWIDLINSEKQLNEASRGGNSLPRYFWLVLDIPTYSNDRTDDLLKSISNCRLQGVRGISDTKQILTSWFGVARNAAIFLDPELIAAHNDIEQIPYHDPDQLVSNDLAFLYRIFDKEGIGAYKHHGVMQNVMDYVKPFLEGKVFQDIQYTGVGKFADAWQKKPEGINDIDDLAAFINAIVENEYGYSVEISELKDAAYKAVNKIGSIYADEGEWIVHSSELIIPMGSTMLVGCDMRAKDRYDEWLATEDKQTAEWWPMKHSMESFHELMTNISKYRLDRRYKIKFIDRHKWEAMREKLWDRRKPTI